MVWIVDAEDFYDSDGTKVISATYGCWVWSCKIAAEDFTLDFMTLNPNSKTLIVNQVLAFQ
jgi:hypothetical protein